MTFYINFDKDGTRYHGIVEVRGNEMKCIDLCSWKYTPGGTPYSVDADLERHREDVENQAIAYLLVDDLDVDSTDNFDLKGNEGIFSCYLGNMCYEIESEVRPQFGTLEEDGIRCHLYAYTRKGDGLTATKMPPARRQAIEKAFKKYLCERYAKMNQEEEASKQEKAEAYERDYHSEYCPEDAEERCPA